MSDDLAQNIATAKRYIGAVWNVDYGTGFWVRAALIDNTILLLMEHSGGYSKGHYLSSTYTNGFTVLGDVTNFRLDPMRFRPQDEYFLVGCPRRTKFLKEKGLI